MDESNHPDWLNKVTWYNTAIYSMLRGSPFEDLYHMQEPIDIISFVL